MVFRQFAILLFAFGLLSATASSSSSESSTTAASEISTSSGTSSEISAAAASEISTSSGTASEISTSSGTASEISAAGAALEAVAGRLAALEYELEGSANPATTTTTKAQAPAYEQAVSFKVDDIVAFADSFDEEKFKNDAVKDSSTMTVEVSVAVKLAFTASYPSATEAKKQVADNLGISEDNVEVAEVTTRRLKSSTRRLNAANKKFSVIATATLETAANVTSKVAQVNGSQSEGVETKVVVTVKIFATPGTTLSTPTLQLKSAAEVLTGVDKSSIKATAVTGEAADDEVADTSSNSVLPWVFTAGLVGIVALF